MNASLSSLFENPLPQSIINHEESGMLDLVWQDGRESRLSHGLLRARCKCAACQQQYRQQGTYPDISPSIRLDAIHPVSDQGLNLVFSDGHGRGIYPWAYLHELSFTPKVEATS
jgi:DUF971 family protein